MADTPGIVGADIVYIDQDYDEMIIAKGHALSRKLFELFAREGRDNSFIDLYQEGGGVIRLSFREGKMHGEKVGEARWASRQEKAPTRWKTQRYGAFLFYKFYNFLYYYFHAIV